MKVLHVTNAYPLVEFHAFGIFIKEQIDSLIKKGINCDIFFINGYQKGSIEYIKSVYKIFKIIKNYDLIHCHHPYSFLTTSIGNYYRIPIVTSILSSMGTSDNKNGILRITVKYSNNIIIKKLEKTTYIYDKIHYIPNGVNLEYFKEIDREKAKIKLGLPKDNQKNILFCSAGGLKRKVKRFDLYLRVLEILQKEHNIFVEKILLINESRERVPYYFNASNVHLLTSDYEGSPNSVKEALACNIPVVSTNVGNVKEMLNSIEGCFVSETNDPYELASLTARALKYDRIKGRKALINNKLDMESVANKIIQLYNKTIKN